MIIRAVLSRISKHCQGGNSLSCDTYKERLNAVIRAHWKADGIDDFIDDEADKTRGVNGAYASSRYFHDQVHPTEEGDRLMAEMASDHVNNLYFGSTPASPNPSVFTAPTCTTSALDGGLNFDTTNGDITCQMFSAKGWTGRIVQRCNISKSPAHRLRITAPTDYSFNNSMGTNEIFVPAGSCIRFEAKFINPVEGGDYWALAK